MAKKASLKTRSLRPDDLERVIDIDRALTGRSRREFFEKRLEAALAHPEEYVAVGVDGDGALIGFAFARIHIGDFGEAVKTAAMDAIGVDQTRQSKGVGRALIDGLDDRLRKREVKEIRTQADWRFHGLVGFFDAVGFTLAPAHVLERPATDRL